MATDASDAVLIARVVSPTHSSEPEHQQVVQSIYHYFHMLLLPGTGVH
jgi:hypothetical protein